MLYSIIIPTYNDEKHKDKYEKYLKPCLESIVKNTDLNNIEIIVVANGCHQNTIDYLNSLKNEISCLKIIRRDKPLGFARAVNLGIISSSGDFCILMNDDCVLLDQNKNEWIEILKRPLEEDFSCVISGPLSLSFEGRDFIVGFLMMIRKTFLTSFGYLDEAFSPGWGEDIDLCFRAKKFGFKIKQCIEVVDNNGVINIGHFPIYHQGEATFHLYPDLVELGRNLHYKMSSRISSGFYN